MTLVYFEPQDQAIDIEPEYRDVFSVRELNDDGEICTSH